ncbi:MAG: DNA repair protein RecO [Agathobacter sp.]|nr:DNA repair protein RecO [Agathobacter sp.]
MTQSVVLTGIVLKAMPVGDYDKRITILTKERGKIVAFARGARRQNSQLLAATAPFSFGEFELFEGKNAYNLSKASIKKYFRELTNNLDAVYIGFYFLEFADYFCQENNDEIEMLKLLYQSLRALESQSFDNSLVKAIFELKAITINGEGPNVFYCVNCHGTENLRRFSVKRAGLYCDRCSGMENGIEISEATRYTLQYIVASKPEKLFNFSVSEEVLSQLIQIVDEYIKFYVHHDFKSLEIMKDTKVFL